MLSFSMAALITTFGAGFLASLTPCVYPMIPVTIGFLGLKESRQPLRLSMYLAGQVAALTLLGLLAVQIGETLGFVSQDSRVQLILGAFFLFLGFISWKGDLPGLMQKLNNFTSRLGRTRSANMSGGFGHLGAFLTGASGALLMSPCTTPVLGGVLALIAGAQSLWIGAGFMFIYALGFITLIAILGFGVMKLDRFPKSGQWMNRVHSIGVISLMALGTYYLLAGFDVFG